MACSSSFLLLLFDLSSFLLAISLLLILLGVVFNFWLCFVCFGRELSRRAKEKMFSCSCIYSFSFSLCDLDKILAKGEGRSILAESLEIGRERLRFYFSFSLVSLLQNFNIAFNGFQILSSGLAKTMCF